MHGWATIGTSARSRCGIRSLTAFAVAAVLASWAVTAPAGAASPQRATLVTAAPARVAVGEPFTVQLAVRGARDVAGYETSLLYPVRAAQYYGFRQTNDSIARTGRGIAALGPVTSTASSASGSIRALSRIARRVQGVGTTRGPRATASSLVAVTLVPDRAGVLELRFARTVVVDTHGREVVLQPSRVVRIRVGGDPGSCARRPRRGGPAHRSRCRRRAPWTSTATTPSRTPTRRPSCSRWTMRRYGARPVCARPRRRRRQRRRLRRRRRRAEGRRRLHAARARAASRRAVADGVDSHADCRHRPTARGPRCPATSRSRSTRVGDDPDANTDRRRSAPRPPAPARCAPRSSSANAHSGATASPSRSPAPASRRSRWPARCPTSATPSGGIEIDGYTQPGASPNTDPLASNAVLRDRHHGRRTTRRVSRPFRITSPEQHDPRPRRSTASGARSGSTARTRTTTSSPATSSAPTRPATYAAVGVRRHRGRRHV